MCHWTRAHWWLTTPLGLGLTFCAPAEEASVVSGDYDALVELFLDFRELQEVELTD